MSRRLAVVLFAAGWGTNQFAPLLLVYRARLGLSPFELGALYGVYAVGLLPGLLFGGRLSDVAGRRAVALPAAALALCGTATLSFGAAGFAVLFAGRFVVGLGSGAVFSAGTAWMQDMAAGSPPGTGARRAAVALLSGFGWGPLTSSAIAQWLPSPMRLPYLIQGAVLLAALAAASTPAPAPAPTPTPTPTPAPTLPPRFLREVAVVAPWVYVFASIAQAVLPGEVRDQVGPLQVIFAGGVTGATLLSAVLVQPALRPWRPRWASIAGLAAGTVGLVCGALATAAGRPAGVLLAAPLLGAGYGGCLIAGLRFVEETTTEATRGGLTGIFYALTYVGFAAPASVAAIAGRTGDVGALLVVAVLAAGTLGWIGADGRA